MYRSSLVVCLLSCLDPASKVQDTRWFNRFPIMEILRIIAMHNMVGISFYMATGFLDSSKALFLKAASILATEMAQDEMKPSSSTAMGHGFGCIGLAATSGC